MGTWKDGMISLVLEIPREESLELQQESPWEYEGKPLDTYGFRACNNLPSVPAPFLDSSVIY